MSGNPGKSRAPENEVTTVSVKTHVDSSRVCLKWDIQNTEMVFPNKTEIKIFHPQFEKEFYATFESLKSPIFVTNLGGFTTKKVEQKWFVKLSVPNFAIDSNEPEKYISLYMYREDPASGEIALQDEKPFRLYMTFYILGEDNVEYLKRSTGTLSTKYLTPIVRGWGFSEFVSLKSLWENRKTYLVDDHVLRIRVQLSVFGSPVTESGVLECVTSVARNKLTNDMRELLEFGRDSDVTIICGGAEILAHAAILKGRCQVFKRMLETGMIESNTKTIKIDDVNPIVLEAFLEYIYTAEVDLSVENFSVLFGLVRVADKYGMDELKSICFKYICENITEENAGEIAVLSLEHNVGDNLRSQVLAFCRSNWSKLSQLEAFKACVLENPHAFFD